MKPRLYILSDTYLNFMNASNTNSHHSRIRHTKGCVYARLTQTSTLIQSPYNHSACCLHNCITSSLFSYSQHLLFIRCHRCWTNYILFITNHRPLLSTSTSSSLESTHPSQSTSDSPLYYHSRHTRLPHLFTPALKLACFANPSQQRLLTFLRTALTKDSRRIFCASSFFVIFTDHFSGPGRVIGPVCVSLCLNNNL